MQESPVYDALVVEFEDKGISIPEILARPLWSFKEALARADRALAAKVKRADKASRPKRAVPSKDTAKGA